MKITTRHVNALARQKGAKALEASSGKKSRVSIPAEWIKHAAMATQIARTVVAPKYWPEHDTAVVLDGNGEYHMFAVNAWKRPKAKGMLPWHPPAYPESMILGVVDADGRVRPHPAAKRI